MLMLAEATQKHLGSHQQATACGRATRAPTWYNSRQPGVLVCAWLLSYPPADMLLREALQHLAYLLELAANYFSYWWMPSSHDQQASHND